MCGRAVWSQPEPRALERRRDRIPYHRQPQFESAWGHNSSNVHASAVTMATDRFPSISIHASTLRVLQPFKKGDMTWDDGLIDFSEEHVPEV